MLINTIERMIVAIFKRKEH